MELAQSLRIYLEAFRHSHVCQKCGGLWNHANPDCPAEELESKTPGCMECEDCMGANENA